jgi:copper chaperone NosL
MNPRRRCPRSSAWRRGAVGASLSRGLKAPIPPVARARRPDPGRSRAAPGALIATLLAAVLLAGCAEPPYPPPVKPGSACALCGMRIENMRFAAEQRVRGSWRVYDSIECLAREAESTQEAFLSDHDSETLHAADSMFVVHGRIDSPMGGGLAAFLTRAQADEVAAAVEGRVLDLATLIAERRTGTP